MYEQVKVVRRESPRRDSVLAELRGSIVRGEMAAGTRLPNREDLERRFNTSRMTVQKAMDVLTRDGFAVARGRLGTYVVEHPPCHSDYAIVVHARPAAPSWSGFDDALLRICHRLDGRDHRRLRIYLGVDHKGEGDYGRLLAAVRGERLAGLLFAQNPQWLAECGLIRHSTISKVAVMTTTRVAPYEQIPQIDLRAESLLALAVRRLHERGCRRLGLLMLGKARNVFLEAFQRQLAVLGLPYRNIWVQAASVEDRRWAGHAAELLMSLPAADRPDGLFVADDNLVEAACGGLLAAGMRPGLDLPVVVHCNFPVAGPPAFPVERIGYDIQELLELAIASLDAQRQGQAYELDIGIDATCEPPRKGSGSPT